MSLSKLPTDPMSKIARHLDRGELLRLSATCKSIRATIAPDVQLVLRTGATSLHLANALLKEYAAWYRCSEISMQLRCDYQMPTVFELSSDLTRCGESDLFAEVTADERACTVAASLRFHIGRYPSTSTNGRLDLHYNVATRLQFKLDRTTARAGVCTGSVMIEDDNGVHARDENGAILYTHVDEAYAEGEVAVLRKLGVLLKK